MELKTARLTVLIDPNKKSAFERLCAQQDRTASQVVRQLIRDYLVEHGVQFVASSATPVGGEHAEDVAPSRARPVSTRKTAATGKPRTSGRKS
jgi:hypothetical protein